MNEHSLTAEQLQSYADHLRLEEKSAATVEKYLRHVRAFARWLGRRALTKAQALELSLIHI